MLSQKSLLVQPVTTFGALCECAMWLLAAALQLNKALHLAAKKATKVLGHISGRPALSVSIISTSLFSVP